MDSATHIPKSDSRQRVSHLPAAIPPGILVPKPKLTKQIASPALDGVVVEQHTRVVSPSHDRLCSAALQAGAQWPSAVGTLLASTHTPSARACMHGAPSSWSVSCEQAGV